MNKKGFSLKDSFTKWTESHKLLFCGVILTLMMLMAATNCLRFYEASRNYGQSTASDQVKKELHKSRAVEDKGAAMEEKYGRHYAPVATAQPSDGEAVQPFDDDGAAVVAYSE